MTTVYRGAAAIPTRPGSAPAGPPLPPPRGRPPKQQRRRDRGPLWARLLVVFGALLMVASGTLIVGVKVLIAQATSSVTQTNLLGNAGNQAVHHVNITGPVNVLLVGIDARPDQTAAQARSDSIIVLHIPASHDQAFLVSIPRDTLVHIPAYAKSGFRGGDNKINAAFSYGSQNGGGVAGGVGLLAATIKSLYGIGFDAAAVVDFEGFRQVVGVLGGVNMCVDEKVTSIHIGFNTKTGREQLPYTQDANLRLHAVPGVRPEVYKPGCYHLAAWQALDYTRQRDLLANGDGDYGRQRHQQQFIKAIFKQILSAGTLTNPAKLAAVLDSVGKAMTVDTGGISIADWIFAMRGVTANNMTTVKTNDGKYNSVNVPGIGSCEQLNASSLELLADIKTDTVADFVTAHPDWVSRS
ncbi:MAG TPA: LCP family protein [Rugosimonospora sp.]|nr:LCP family protein [Rugosimonospora sp.]